MPPNTNATHAPRKAAAGSWHVCLSPAAAAGGWGRPGTELGWSQAGTEPCRPCRRLHWWRLWGCWAPRRRRLLLLMLLLLLLPLFLLWRLRRCRWGAPRPGLAPPGTAGCRYAKGWGGGWQQPAYTWGPEALRAMGLGDRRMTPVRPLASTPTVIPSPPNPGSPTRPPPFPHRKMVYRKPLP